MMNKKPSLAERMRQTTTSVAATSPVSSLNSASEPELIPPSRRGKVQIAGHFDPAVRRQLKGISADEEISTQELLAEALNLLFEKRGKSRIA